MLDPGTDIATWTEPNPDWEAVAAARLTQLEKAEQRAERCQRELAAEMALADSLGAVLQDDEIVTEYGSPIDARRRAALAAWRAAQ